MSDSTLRRWGRALGVLALALAAGCIQSKFSCKGYPDGVRCERVSRVADELRDGSGTTAGSAHQPSTSPSGSATPQTGSAVVGQPPIQLGRPIVKPPLVARVWVAPWRDTNNVLHEAAYVYLIVEPADWDYGQPAPVSHGGGRRRTLVPTAPSVRPDWSVTRGGAGTAGGRRSGARTRLTQPQPSQTGGLPSIPHAAQPGSPLAIPPRGGRTTPGMLPMAPGLGGLGGAGMTPSPPTGDYDDLLEQQLLAE
jgi:type IV conjugative transfer system lipoprotein TraV